MCAAAFLIIAIGCGEPPSTQRYYTSHTIQHFTDSCTAGGVPVEECACMITRIADAFSEQEFLEIDAVRLRDLSVDARLRDSTLERWTVMKLNRVTKSCTPTDSLFQPSMDVLQAPTEVVVAAAGRASQLKRSHAVALIGGGGGVSLGYYLVIAGPRKRRRKEDGRRRRELDSKQRIEAQAAEPLTVLTVGKLLVLADVAKLTADFDTLTTFADVDRWNAKASDIADNLEETCNRQLGRAQKVRALVTSYQATNHDLPHVSAARIFKTEQELSACSVLVEQLTALYETVSERVDMSPNNADEKRNILKELRAEKKELLANKVVAQASTGRSVPAPSTAAPPSPWSTRELVADERRAIRRKKEAPPGPGENPVTALDRQLHAVERRMAWAQRVGDRSLDTTEPA